MNLFPFDVINRILEYDGRIKYRNGKYMNKIAQDDYRYKILQTISHIKPFHKNHKDFWLVIISTNNNFIEIYKSLSYYLEDKPCIHEINYDKTMSYSCFIRKGICYAWKITKKSITPSRIENARGNSTLPLESAKV